VPRNVHAPVARRLPPLDAAVRLLAGGRRRDAVGQLLGLVEGKLLVDLAGRGAGLGPGVAVSGLALAELDHLGAGVRAAQLQGRPSCVMFVNDGHAARGHQNRKAEEGSFCHAWLFFLGFSNADQPCTHGQRSQTNALFRKKPSQITVRKSWSRSTKYWN